MAKTTRSQYRQGDVLLVPIDDIPSEAKEVEVKGDVVLAYGEVTGHSHRFAHDMSNGMRMYRDTVGGLFLSLKSPSDLVHEEHATHTVPPGKYAVRLQREYTPQAWRQVAD